MLSIRTDEEAADALRELGNIAFSHAATALATLLHKRVDVAIPSVRVVEREQIEGIGRGEDLHVVSFRLAGDHTGVVAVLFPHKDAAALLGILHGRPMPAGLDPEGESTLLEIGNIMAGSALLAAYRLLGATLLHGTPSLQRRRAGRLAEDGLLSSPVVLVLEAELSVEGRQASATMAISPDDPAPLLERLGVAMEADRWR